MVTRELTLPTYWLLPLPEQWILISTRFTLNLYIIPQLYTVQCLDKYGTINEKLKSVKKDLWVSIFLNLASISFQCR